MSISASVLETLHRIHRQKTDLTGQLDRGPKQIQAAKNRIEACKKALEEIREKAKTAAYGCRPATIAVA